MNKPIFRRVIAFIIDMLIVTIIVSALSNIKIFNPEIEKYNDTYDQYMEYIKTGVNEDNIQSIVNSDEYKNIVYNISYYGRYSNIITIVVSLLYFVVFQYFTKGYTGGKKLLNIKVESIKGPLKIQQLLLRSLIINGLFTSLITTITIFILNEKNFMSIETYIELINILLLFVTFGMVLYREDGRGLHDLLGKTRVVKN